MSPQPAASERPICLTDFFDKPFCPQAGLDCSAVGKWMSLHPVINGDDDRIKLFSLWLLLRERHCLATTVIRRHRRCVCRDQSLIILKIKFSNRTIKNNHWHLFYCTDKIRMLMTLKLWNMFSMFLEACVLQVFDHTPWVTCRWRIALRWPISVKWMC